MRADRARSPIGGGQSAFSLIRRELTLHRAAARETPENTKEVQPASGVNSQLSCDGFLAEDAHSGWGL